MLARTRDNSGRHRYDGKVATAGVRADGVILGLRLLNVLQLTMKEANYGISLSWCMLLYSDVAARADCSLMTLCTLGIRDLS